MAAAKESVQYDELLRLIKITRREKARISQREAAGIAGISQPWWRNIEAGRVRVDTDTLARMMFALDIEPELLYNMGHEDIARGIEERQKFLDSAAQGSGNDAAEAHLMRTPELNPRQRYSLLAHLRAIRELDQSDPLSRDWGFSLLDRRK